MAQPSLTPSDLLAQLDPQALVAQRHLWLVSALSWIRGNGQDAQACIGRIECLLDELAAQPDRLQAWQSWWAAFRENMDLAPLLADFGFAPRTAFLSELGFRLRNKLLPGTPDTSHPSELFSLVFPTESDTEWIGALPPSLLLRLKDTLFAPDDEAPTTPDVTRTATTTSNRWLQELTDAILFSVSQVSATGFAAEVRVRMSQEALRSRAFLALPGKMDALQTSLATFGPRSKEAAAAADALRKQLATCLEAAKTVYAHLDEHGISVGIVFRLRQLRDRVQRIHHLLNCLLSANPAQATVTLLLELVHVGHRSRSVRALIASSTHLTAAKVAERSAETGEHYITRDRAEYMAMLRHAAGGGAIIGFTTWGKFLLYGLALSPFWMGFAAGMNYALSFVLVQLLHWTVATKQPAVTAPAMVAKLKDLQAPGAVMQFVDEVANLFRSQVAAIAGNLALVVPVVLLISFALNVFSGSHMIDAEKAHHVLHDMNVVGPTALFAAFTGVLLFASSIVAGWFENWFVLHRLDSALTHHPRATRWLGKERALRWATWLRANVSGLAANVSLGLMLGIVPVVFGFFGLGLEVRHVTLSAGQVSAAVATLGWSALLTPGFWLAVAGIAVVGPINLAVSFYLAFRLALKAQAISNVNRERIRAALWLRWRNAPMSFLLPPQPASVADDPPPTKN
ncbi:MAG TPA: site-specific recombinase [Burkholderiaceae bacterium]|nr:site-specific recombinase [Burkholderiaceae bacterium]